MRIPLALFLTLGVVCCSSQAADDAPLKAMVKKQVEGICDATINNDAARISDSTHPKLVELLGGREKMIETTKSALAAMKAQGFSVKSAKVDDPSNPVAGGADLYIVVPFEMVITAPGAKVRAKSYLIGVSSDKGKSWTYIGADKGEKIIKDLLPNLPNELKLPKQEAPVIEKD